MQIAGLIVWVLIGIAMGISWLIYAIQNSKYDR